jgi:hypothetical protein
MLLRKAITQSYYARLLCKAITTTQGYYARLLRKAITQSYYARLLCKAITTTQGYYARLLRLRNSGEAEKQEAEFGVRSSGKAEKQKKPRREENEREKERSCGVTEKLSNGVTG